MFHIWLVSLWSFQNEPSLENSQERRLCADYRALINLLPPVTKGHAKAKAALELVPLIYL